MASGTGKLLYDVTLARLAAQKESQAALVSRAKDLLGVTAISTAINSTALLRSKAGPPWWWTALALAAVVVQIGGALVVLFPRGYDFSTDPEHLRKLLAERSSGDDTLDDWYRALADGFLHQDATATSKIAHNHELNRRNSLIVKAQTVALGVTLVLAIIRFAQLT